VENRNKVPIKYTGTEYERELKLKKNEIIQLFRLLTEKKIKHKYKETENV